MNCGRNVKKEIKRLEEEGKYNKQGRTTRLIFIWYNNK